MTEPIEYILPKTRRETNRSKWRIVWPCGRIVDQTNRVWIRLQKSENLRRLSLTQRSSRQKPTIHRHATIAVGQKQTTLIEPIGPICSGFTRQQRRTITPSQIDRRLDQAAKLTAELKLRLEISNTPPIQPNPVEMFNDVRNHAFSSMGPPPDPSSE
ncbi:MAG: hypothetical protein B7X49_17340 [Acidiphilium sp. 34-64-41]|nr:MAG: hypothetical protein B7X49_17340 [Acidiphilium sp. 34-64-41]